MAWDVAQQPKSVPLPDGYLGTQRRFPLIKRKSNPSDGQAPVKSPSLAVRVSVRFEDAVQVNYSRSYEASPAFEATDSVCDALIRRIGHCSEELITRRDCHALHCSQGFQVGRPLRFTMTFQVDKGMKKAWAERTFKSYQKQPLTMDSARHVVLATDRMIGLFLRRHDSQFRWTDGAIREHSPSRPRVSKPHVNRPQSLSCVPRSRFMDSVQQFEFLPGYEIEVSFKSRCRRRKPVEWSKIVRLSSNQSTPFTLALGEDILWKSSRALNDAFDLKKRSFDQQHRCCDGLEGVGGCQHVQDGAVDIQLRIRNNIGPDYDHLTNRLHTKLALFSQPDGQDCSDFVQRLERVLTKIRNEADDQISHTSDLRVKVHEMRGPGWRLESPFGVSLDSTVSYSRRSVEAILDRVQTGIADVLHGHNVSITLSAHKRGHLILDKTLIAHEDRTSFGQHSSETSDTLERKLVDMVHNRLQVDIARVCIDTCNLDSCTKNIPSNMHFWDESDRSIATDDEQTQPWVESQRNESYENQKRSVTDDMAASSGAIENEEVIRDQISVELPKEQNYDLQPGVQTMPMPHEPSTPVRDTGTSLANSIETSMVAGSSSFTATSDDEYSITPSTPSLADCDSISARDHFIITPSFVRTVSGTPEHISFMPQIADGEQHDINLTEEAFNEYSHPPVVSIIAKQPSQETAILDAEVHVEPNKSKETPPATVVEPHPTVGEPLHGWLEYCCEPLDDDEAPLHDEDSLTEPSVKALVDLKTALLPLAASPPCDLTNLGVDRHLDNRETLALAEIVTEGWLEYSVEEIDLPISECGILEVESSNGENVQIPESGCLTIPPADANPTTLANTEPDHLSKPDEDIRQNFLPLLSFESESKRRVAVAASTPPIQTSLPDEAEVTQPVAQSQPFLPSLPTTSDYSDDSVGAYFPDLARPPSAPATVIGDDNKKALTAALWAQSRPDYFPDDDESDEDIAAVEVPRPKSALPFSRPFSHRRQYSSPTAGFLGLHEEQFVEVGLRNALIGQYRLNSRGSTSNSKPSTDTVSPGRRSSSVLAALSADMKGHAFPRAPERRGSEKAALPGLITLATGATLASHFFGKLT
jgi:hypothetical protein